MDIYSLQLAYTTNCFLLWYLPGKLRSGQKVVFTYTDENGDHTERFSYDESEQVIAAKPLGNMSKEEIAAHQSHTLSYGDDKGLNPVDVSRVQSNAEPLYWLAGENGLNVMKPQNIQNHEVTNSAYFCDYYVIKIHWDEGTVINDKETDMVYLTVSR